MPTPVKSWKFLVFKDGKITSAHNANLRHVKDRCTWEVGEWKHAEGFIQACRNGFHHSNNPYDAFTYVAGDVLARVEVRGTTAEDLYGEPNHKAACSDMRIVEAASWGKNESITLGLRVASLAAAMLPVGNEYRKLAERGMAAVRSYLTDGTKIPPILIDELSMAPYEGCSVGGVHPADAVAPAWFAAHSTTDKVRMHHVGTNAIYGIGRAMDLIDGPGGQQEGTVKAAVNKWMENRFKTLPRF